MKTYHPKDPVAPIPMNCVEEEEKLLAAIPDPVVSTPTVTPTVVPVEKSSFNGKLVKSPNPRVTPTVVPVEKSAINK